MIPAKVLTSILLLLITFIHTFPLELVNDTSLQRSNVVIRQTTSPDATGLGSLNLTRLVDFLGGLVQDIEEIEMLQELGQGISAQQMEMLLGDIEGITSVIDSLVTTGPVEEPFNVEADLKSLIGALENLTNALSDFLIGNSNSLQSVSDALGGTVRALIAVLNALLNLVTTPNLGPLASAALKGLPSDLVGLLNSVIMLQAGLAGRR